MKGFNYLNRGLLGFFGIAILMGASCTAPVNLNYESARMMKKGEVEVQGSYSQYFEGAEKISSNVGGRIGFGINENYNLKMRVEIIALPQSVNASEVDPDLSFLYFELDNKISLTKNLALSLPLCHYSLGDGMGYSVFDPRLYITMRSNDVFEFTVIPKCHFFLDAGSPPMPAISVGMGFSSDLNKWAIRPEIGYDVFFSAGVGLSFYLGGTQKKADK